MIDQAEGQVSVEVPEFYLEKSKPVSSSTVRRIITALEDPFNGHPDGAQFSIGGENAPAELNGVVIYIKTPSSSESRSECADSHGSDSGVRMMNHHRQQHARVLTESVATRVADYLEAERSRFAGLRDSEEWAAFARSRVK